MANERLSMPSSGGGLVRYFDEYKSKIQMRPEFVIAVIIIVVAFEILLKIFG